MNEKHGWQAEDYGSQHFQPHPASHNLGHAFSLGQFRTGLWMLRTPGTWRKVNRNSNDHKSHRIAPHHTTILALVQHQSYVLTVGAESRLFVDRGTVISTVRVCRKSGDAHLAREFAWIKCSVRAVQERKWDRSVAFAACRGAWSRYSTSRNDL